MDNRKAKPSATSSTLRRSVIDSISRLASSQSSASSSTAKPGPSQHQQPHVPNNKRSANVVQKHGKTYKELEKSKPNSSFGALVHVLVAVTKWRKFTQQAAEKSHSTRTQSLPLAPLQPSGSKETSSTVNGTRVYGISKGMIQRAVVKFDEPPPKQPMTVCFHFPSTFLTHRYVLDINGSCSSNM